jgi:hypothetical protein
MDGMIAERAVRVPPPAHMPTSPHLAPHISTPHAHIPISQQLYAPHHLSPSLAMRRVQLAVIRRARALQISVLWRNFGSEHHGVRRDFPAIKDMCGQLPK